MYDNAYRYIISKMISNMKLENSGDVSIRASRKSVFAMALADLVTQVST